MQDFPPRDRAPVIYQIYPRSFRDSTGSGLGDLNGITSRLDRVAELGVDYVWMSPFYLTPMRDGGYDIIDHHEIDPRFGTMADFERLVARAHDLGLKVMLDQVLNHTSDQAQSFLDAIDGDAEKADYYLWRDAKPDGTPPNNWQSQFGGGGWKWNHKRAQYYFHQFTEWQPALNLRNPKVQEEIRIQMKSWTDRGVDGFRFDVVTSFLWDVSLKDNPPARPEVAEKVSGPVMTPYKHQDHVYDMLPGDGASYTEKLRDWAGPGLYLIGENSSGNQSVEIAMAFSDGPDRLDAAYTTDLPSARGAPACVVDMIERADSLMRLPGWLTSHDQPRHGRGDLSDAVLALQMAFLPGPWILYQGEELGLTQPDLKKEEVTDPFDLMYWPDGPGREGARVPLPWDADAPNFGFTEGDPWLPMRWDPDALRRAQGEDGLRAFYAGVIALRRDCRWNTANVTFSEARGDLLELRIATEDGEVYLGLFGHGGWSDDGAPEGTPLVTTDDVAAAPAKGWRGAVWKI